MFQTTNQLNYVFHISEHLPYPFTKLSRNPEIVTRKAPGAILAVFPTHQEVLQTHLDDHGKWNNHGGLNRPTMRFFICVCIYYIYGLTIGNYVFI
jgi:hypothetical protein